MNNSVKSIEQQLVEFRQRRFLAMPLSGLIVWTLLIFTGLFLPAYEAVMTIFIGSGSIVYLAMFVSRFTGERIRFEKASERNFFDSIFLATMVMSLLCFSIAIPFFQQDYRSIPFTLAVLSGLMWLPVSTLLGHWVGYVHTLLRVGLCTLAWYLAPEHSFVLQPMIVVLCYVVSIVGLERRWQSIKCDRRSTQVGAAATV
jgi:magnesium-transporting ATPase (P-type)